MKVPRVTLATASLVVLILAVDFGLMRQFGWLDDRPFDDWTFIAPGFLVMGNILALGLYRLRRPERRGPFAVGFLAVGWAATLAYLAACAVDPGGMVNRFERFDEGVLVRGLDLFLGLGRDGTVRWRNDEGKWAGIADDLGVLSLFFSAPPLVAAVVGGLVARRVFRRPPDGVDEPRRGTKPTRPRASVADLGLLILVVAADFGLARHLIVNMPGSTTGTVLGLLPMVNLLGFGLYRLIRRRGDRRPFTIGCEVAGWPATVGLGLLAGFTPGPISTFLPRFARFAFHTADLLLGDGPGGAHRYFFQNNDHFPLGVAFELSLVAAFYSTPPLLAALAGGMVAHLAARRSSPGGKRSQPDSGQTAVFLAPSFSGRRLG